MNKAIFGPKNPIFIETEEDFLNSKQNVHISPYIPTVTVEERKSVDYNKNPILLVYLRKFVTRLKQSISFKYAQLLKDYHYNLLSDPSCHFKEDPKPDSLYVNLLKKLIISPYHPVRLLWSVFLLLFLIFSFVYIPMEISFDFFGPFTDGFHVIGIIMLSFDIGISLITGTFFNGSLLLDPTKTCMNYMRTMFCSDLLGLLSMVYGLIYQSYQLNLPLSDLGKLFIYCKISKFSWIIRTLSNYFKIEHKYKSYVDLIKVMGTSLIIAHVIACLWHLIADLDTNRNWIIASNLQNDQWSMRYVYSIYWAITTMMTVGYGDIVPKSPAEIIFAIIVIIFGCVVYGYNLNTIGIVVHEISKNENQFNADLQTINSFMNRKKIDNNLQTRVQEYLHFKRTEKLVIKAEEETKIIESLSESLRNELLVGAYGEIFKKSPLLVKYFSQKSLTKVISIIKEMNFVPGDEIYEAGSVDNCSLYYVNRGSVEFFFNESNEIDSYSPNIIQILKEGETFGEYSFFTSKPHQFSCRAHEFTSIFVIDKDKFETIMKENSQDYESYCLIRDSLLLSNESRAKLIGMNCLSCESRKHTVLYCPLIHYVPDKEKIIKRHEFNQNQERALMHRKQHFAFSPRKCANAAARIMKSLKNEKEELQEFRSLIFKTHVISIKPTENDSDDDDVESEGGNNEPKTAAEDKKSIFEEKQEKKLDEDKDLLSPTTLSKSKKRVSSATFHELEQEDDRAKKTKSIEMKSNEYFKNKTISDLSKQYHGEKQESLSTKSTVKEREKPLNDLSYLTRKFESVCEFIKYFPESNCGEVLKRYDLQRRKNMYIQRKKRPTTSLSENLRTTDIIRQKIEEKAKNFAKYCFDMRFYPEILKKTYEKMERSSPRNRTKKSHPDDSKSRITVLSPKKGISFFSSFRNVSQKSSFTEIVSSLLHKQKKVLKK